MSNEIPQLFYPPWLLTAQKELGVSEISGSKHNQRIIEYHQTTTLKATQDEVPWCSSFINWCMTQNFIKGTDSAAARSWLTWGVELKTNPPYGSIVVLKRGNNPASGHVGILVYFGVDKIILLGGNQGDKVSIAPFKKSDVLSYRWAA
jgi:uncharacterized protein (TIGR02594 family)